MAFSHHLVTHPPFCFGHMKIQGSSVRRASENTVKNELASLRGSPTFHKNHPGWCPCLAGKKKTLADVIPESDRPGPLPFYELEGAGFLIFPGWILEEGMKRGFFKYSKDCLGKQNVKFSLPFAWNYARLMFGCCRRSLMIKMGKIIISLSVQFDRWKYLKTWDMGSNRRGYFKCIFYPFTTLQGMVDH